MEACSITSTPGLRLRIAVPAKARQQSETLLSYSVRPVIVEPAFDEESRLIINSKFKTSIHKSAQSDAVHQTQHQEYRPRVRSSRTHKRERNPGDRHPAHHHSNIYQYVK